MMKDMKLDNLKRSRRIVIAFLIGAITAIVILKIYEELRLDEEISNKSNTPFSYHLAAVSYTHLTLPTILLV